MLRKLQKEALDAWLNFGKKGVVVLPTGTGKSFVGLAAAVQISKEIDEAKILFLAETRAREKTLKEELIKYSKLSSDKTPEIEFMCYQSAYKLTDQYYDLVIADEIHSSISEKYKEFYDKNSYKYIIGLTATPRVDKELSLNFYEKIPIVFEATIKDAVDSGAILDYKLHIINHKLDNKDAYIEAGRKGNKFFTTEKKHYEFLNKMLIKNYYTNKGLLKLFIARRAKFLYNLKSKIGLTKKLISKGDRVIVFANSLEFLEQVCDHVVKGSDPNTLQYIDDFNEGKISVIGSFKMLEQGVNLKGVDTVVLASYFSVSGTFLQRIGRALRKDSKTPNIYIIRTLNTAEEKWVNSQLSAVPKNKKR